MSSDKILSGLKAEFTQRMTWFTQELSKIRSGRVNASLVEHIKVEAYGSTLPLNQLATISTPDPKCLNIQPWDKSQLEAIEKSLLKADIGVTPTNDGNLIRLNFPPLSEDRRKEMVKLVKKLSEEVKVAARSIRRDALNQVQALKKQMSEDDVKKLEETVQKELTAYEKKVSDVTEQKSSELLKV